MKVSLPLLLLLTSLIFGGTVISGTGSAIICDGEEFERCTDDVRRLGNAAKSPMMLNDVEAERVMSIDDACRLLERTKKCDYLVCTDILKLNWIGTRNTLNYACGKGNELFKKNSQCWKGHASTETSRCTRVEQDNTADKCGAHNAAIECMMSAVTKHCDPEATMVMKIFQLHRRKPLATEINCSLIEDDGDWDDDGVKDNGDKMASTSLTLLLLSALSISFAAYAGN